MRLVPAGVTRRDLAAAAMLGATCGAVYVVLVRVLGPLLAESPESAEIGGMWGVAATIFVYRSSVSEGLRDAWSRLTATTMSLLLCLTYLVAFPVSVLGIAVVIALGSVLALLVGRPQDASLTGITSIVVLVVADLGRPAPGWLQPLLRLFDTAVGIAAGLVAAMLFTWIAARLRGRYERG